MSAHIDSSPPWTRRKLLQFGIFGLGATVATTAIARYALNSPSAIVRVPPLPDDRPDAGNGIDPMTFLRSFETGTLKRENGRTVREFHLTAHTTPIQLNRFTPFITWNYNGQVPGPTLRVTEGDWVRVVFHNQGGHSHSVHFHGIHSAEADGVRPIRNGETEVYEFQAKPFGVHLYHCHVEPVTRHLGKGMYGMFIVDPPEGRPPADEIVIVMSGYDLDDNRGNELYAFNGIPDYYLDRPIPIQQGQLVRLYLLNMVEFDPALTFHIHANFFQVYRTGRTLKPSEDTDVITLGTTERHILEFQYDYPGRFMFHPHQDWIAEHGCMGNFEVVEA
ncbi:multicopper oxidase domain-containing protein [Geitlerinema sp. CS-897]|nr:multicopper oxidase domain-containing protein [Geitlerinema sp. CS-897]